MLEVGQLEDLGWDGGEAVAVEPKNLQTVGQVGEAARLQWRDTIVVEQPEKKKDLKVCLKWKDTGETGFSQHVVWSIYWFAVLWISVMHSDPLTYSDLD